MDSLKKSLILIAVLFFIVSGSCFSQRNFRDGFVVKSGGDTLYGLVNYREGSGAFRQCEFRESFENEVITYRPGEIQKYGFERDKVLESREITLQEEPPRTVFLEILVDGLASLYKFDDTYWVEKDSGGLHQLRNEPRVIETEGKMVLGSTNEHISILSMLLYDCPEVMDNIQGIGSIRERPLTNAIEEYNMCMGVPYIVYKDQKPWIEPSVGITGGLNNSRIKFDELKGGFSQVLGTTEVTNSPSIALSLGFYFPRINERISFHLDFFYISAKYYRHGIIEETNTTTTDYVDIELDQLKIPAGFRYTLTKRNFTPYFSIGVSQTFHLKYSSSWTRKEERHNLDIVNTYNYDEAFPMKSSQLGIWGSAGIQRTFRNRLVSFIELRFEQTNGIATKSETQPYYDLKSNVTNLQLFTGIRF